MRYPLWAFFFVLVMPVFTAHALVTGKAQSRLAEPAPVTQADMGARPYWTHQATRS